MRRKQAARIHMHRARIERARLRAVVGAGGNEVEQGTGAGMGIRVVTSDGTKIKGDVNTVNMTAEFRKTND